VCYHTGCGVEQNLCQAAELYKEAAQLGHKEAQLMLATFFHYGLGGMPLCMLITINYSLFVVFVGGFGFKLQKSW